jgi:hypothetical protein
MYTLAILVPPNLWFGTVVTKMLEQRGHGG